MGRFLNALSGLTLGANATIIDSEVDLPESEQRQFEGLNIQAPITSRDMTNAPEHLYNIFAIYEMAKLGLPWTTVSIFYTVRGDTLIAGAGTTQNGQAFIPSVYETEFGTLNASVAQNLGAGWEAKLSAKNLLDPEIETVYRSEFIGSDVVKTSYQKGMEFSFGLSASF